jgi:hypothetical protein
MPIKVVLTLALAVLWVYALVQRVAPRSVRVGTAVVVMMGVYFVWLPDHTTLLANWLGVGRGTDLVIYVWILLSFAVGLNLSFKIRALRREITDLTRAIAVATPRRADAAYMRASSPDSTGPDEQESM